MAKSALLRVRKVVGTGVEKITDLNVQLDDGSVVLEDLGSAAVGYFYLDGVAVDTKVLTINGRSYQTLMTATTLTGDVRVSMQADATADAVCTLLAAGINADASASVDAIVMPGNSDTTAGIMLVAKAVGATNFTLVTDQTNGTVSAAAMTGARPIEHRESLIGQYTWTAADAATCALTGANSVPIAGIPCTGTPMLVGVFVKLTGGGWVVPVATVLFTLAQVNSNFYVLYVDDAAATLTAADVISYHVIA